MKQNFIKKKFKVLNKNIKFYKNVVRKGNDRKWIELPKIIIFNIDIIYIFIELNLLIFVFLNKK